MSKKKPLEKQRKQILIVVITLFFLVILPLGLSYTNFYPPLIPKKYIFILDSFVADLPFLPKTPKQIVTKSLIRNRNLSSYSLTSNLDLETKKAKLAEVNISQYIENAGGFESKSKNKIKGEISFLPDGKIDIETVKIQNNLAFKITTLPNGIGVNIAKLKQDWYKIDLKTFQEGLSVNTRNDQQIIDDIRKAFSEIQTSLIDQSVFSKVTSSKKVKLDGNNFYEIKFALDPNNFKDLPFFPNLKFEKPVLTLWVNAASFYLTKIDLFSELVSSTETKVEANSTLGLHLTSELSSIGAVQNISFPDKLSDIKSPVDLALKLTESVGSVDNLFEATKTAKDTGENFLTIERLLTVILLLPKSI